MMSAPIPECAPPDPATRPPSFAFPPLACDCHAHVCGPQSRFPYAAQRIYTPPDAPIADYERMLDVLGVGRAVLVQPSFYGTDNSAMLAAMKSARRPVRGVVVIGDEVDERALADLHAAGIRGVRFNIVDLAEGKGRLPIERLRATARRIAAFGWHIELLMHVNEFPDLDRVFGDLPVDVVVGHLGYVPTGNGLTDPGFASLLRLMKVGKAWAKLTGPYRISPGSMPHADTDAFAHKLMETNPARVVWGTDWPHVKAQWTIPMPNDGAIADLLLDWIPDASLRRRVLAENPATLYDFS
jgi:2-pyrone-4,6-dicarboxylate lactonase